MNQFKLRSLLLFMNQFLLQMLDYNLRLIWQDADADFKINWKRVAITSSFGFGFVGPVGHFWFVFPIYLFHLGSVSLIFVCQRQLPTANQP